MADTEQPELEQQQQPAGGEEQQQTEGTDTTASQEPQQEEQATTGTGAEEAAESQPAEEQTQEAEQPVETTAGATDEQQEEKPEEQPAEQQEGEGAAPPTEGAGEEEAPKPQEEEKKEEEPPVVVTPEGNPHWLSNEDILAKGVPEDEVENYKNFHFKQAHSLQTFYESLKDHTFQTEFTTLTSEEVAVLLAASHPGQAEGPELSEEQKEALTQLEKRIGDAISLYDEDGAFIKVNTRSPKDAILERSDAHFIAEVRDAVINELEVEKQSANAYTIWGESHRPGMIRRGIQSIRRSMRRPRADSAGPRVEKPKLEEEKKEEEKPEEGEKKEGEEEKKEEGETKEGEGEKKEGEEQTDGGEKKEEEGEAPKEQGEQQAEGGEEQPAQTVTVDVTVEGGEQQQEEPSQEAPAEPPAQQEEPPQPEVQETPKQEEGETKEGEGEGGAQPAEGEGEKKEEKTEGEGEGEIQEVGKEEEGKEVGKEGEKEEEKKKRVPRSVLKKSKVSEEHTHRKSKAEPLDNQVLRAFGRAIETRYRVATGKESIELLLRSVTAKQDLTQVKAFGAVEDARVSLSIRRWQAQVPRYPGMEFRGFVYNNELNALSQIDDTTYYPNVFHYKITIQQKVEEFFREHVKETLKELENYIIDFFVAPDKVYVTSLSPFYTSIGACLFTWQEHAKILVKGPIEFRIIEKSKTAPACFSSLQPEWREMVVSVVDQKRNERRERSSNCVLL